MFVRGESVGSSAIIISASSDIGSAIGRSWIERGWNLFGTYRTESQAVEELSSWGMKMGRCDLSNQRSILDACVNLRALCPQWDALVLCPGTQDPVSAFQECNFDEWEESLKINFTGPMRIVRELLPTRRVDSKLGSCVLFFAGGGTNNATVNYSAYTVSKIALIKMCELLDAEIPDCRFVIVGPGWVKTKIHESTLKAGVRAGPSYQKTLDKLASDECTSFERIVACCDWLVDSPREVVSGRNFSVVYDPWGNEILAKKLTEEPHMYKLRRFGNDWVLKNGS
ncbi:MAG: SDR family oxidoreductase [Chlamydiae bacterium]|nr:SDR family oxidoreductase [Chlamydiota bacterium]MBI3276250.1 SDR family oxidoreductase [Chlamydiota bacterium]